MLVKLALSAVLAEEATEDTHAADPHKLAGEASLTGTTARAEASVTTLGLGLSTLVGAPAGVDDVLTADDQAILEELADILACKG